MSGGISFSDDIGWVKAGWIYRAVLVFICKHLESENNESELYKELSDPEGNPRVVEHIFAEDWASEKIIQLCRAIESGYSIAEAEGPLEWREPEAFPVFLNAFTELLKVSEDVKNKHC